MGLDLGLKRSQGRLAWQETEIDANEVLWHNGMVGGSASFLGVVPSMEIGVVVLTNTAKSVDSVGLKILQAWVRTDKTPTALRTAATGDQRVADQEQ